MSSWSKGLFLLKGFLFLFFIFNEAYRCWNLLLETLGTEAKSWDGLSFIGRAFLHRLCMSQTYDWTIPSLHKKPWRSSVRLTRAAQWVKYWKRGKRRKWKGSALNRWTNRRMEKNEKIWKNKTDSQKPSLLRRLQIDSSAAESSVDVTFCRMTLDRTTLKRLA